MDFCCAAAASLAGCSSLFSPLMKKAASMTFAQVFGVDVHWTPITRYLSCQRFIYSMLPLRAGLSSPGYRERTPCDGTGSVRAVGILRLRECLASRGTHFAQDDRTKKQSGGGSQSLRTPPLNFGDAQKRRGSWFPPFGFAQGRLFRKGRERWGTLSVVMPAADGDGAVGILPPLYYCALSMGTVAVTTLEGSSRSFR